MDAAVSLLAHPNVKSATIDADGLQVAIRVRWVDSEPAVYGTPSRWDPCPEIPGESELDAESEELVCLVNQVASDLHLSHPQVVDTYREEGGSVQVYSATVLLADDIPF